MIQSREPTTPIQVAVESLTSMSQRICPCHQAEMLSVGQMRALMKFMKLHSMTHDTSDDAPIL